MPRWFMLLLFLPMLLAAFSWGAAAGQTTGEISGVVFHDDDEDGNRDPGEAGLPGRSVSLIMDGQVLSTAHTGEGGSYGFTSLAAGNYSVSADTSAPAAGPCPLPSEFNPLALAIGCVSGRAPWPPTSPSVVTLSVAAGAGLTADFGARPGNVMLITGIGLLNDDYAPTGTNIRAVVDGTECGASEVTALQSGPNYSLTILGESEKAGCATAGDAVTIEISGVRALDSVEFQPSIQTASSGATMFLRHVIASPLHSWFWAAQFDVPAETAARLAGQEVVALVNGQKCGATKLPLFGAEATSMGFSRLVVPSSQIPDGCGSEGQTVTFSLVGGADRGG